MDREFWVLLGLLNIVRVVLIVPDNVSLAGLQAGAARLRIRQRFQNDPIEVRVTLVPVVRILFENHAVARGP